jgi:acyl-CoA thioesterase-1
MVPASALRAAQTIVILGDSISAGYGLAQGEGWVALL